MKKKKAQLIGWKRVYSHVTRMQITNSARAAKISSVATFCDKFFMKIIYK